MKKRETLNTLTYFSCQTFHNDVSDNFLHDPPAKFLYYRGEVFYMLAGTEG